MTYGHGSLWAADLAIPIGPQSPPGPGELFRIDPRSLTVTAHWAAVGSPVAIVVTDHYVWVAGGAGDIRDHRPPAWGASHVQQFDLSGTLLHTYAVDTPVAMAGDGDTVWIEYGHPGGAGYLGHLHDGVADPPVQLGGSASTLGQNAPTLLVRCADGVYAVSVNEQLGSAFVDRVVAGRPAARVTLPLQGRPQLGCGPGQGVMMITANAASSLAQQVLVGAEAAGPSVALPGQSGALGTADNGVWIGRFVLLSDPQGTTEISLLDKNFLPRSGTLLMPGEVEASATDGVTLWVITTTFDPNNPGGPPMRLSAITIQ
jgi:hypothetical protein